MNASIDLPITSAPARNSMKCSPLRRAFLLIPLLLACFGFSPTARAVLPAPDGGYGGNNTAEGTGSLFNLTTGVWNSAFGFRALYKNSTGIGNTAIGYQALYNNNGSFNVTAKDNVAVGANALFSNTTGVGNIAIGSRALYKNTTGSNNIAIGNHALQNLPLFSSFPSGNTVIGDSFASSPTAVVIGRGPTFDSCNLATHGVLNAYIQAENNVSVGTNFGGCPNIKTLTVHLVAQDAVYVDAVYGNAIAGSPVNINSNGQLGVASSSARFKDEIKPMDKASEAILALKPVTFHYKKEIDPKRIAQFGLVAEEVEKVNPALITRDAKGEVYTVRYEAVNAMLLNEFLKEHRKVERQECKIREQGATIAQLKATVAQQQKDFIATAAQQQKQIEVLTAGLQKVSAQIETGRPAAQVVVNDQ
jgi:uncharacterized coiled-coil protein SlyX